MALPQLSVVAPVFNECENLPELAAQVQTALEGQVSFELVLVDDGSSDDSHTVLHQLAADHAWLKPVIHPANAGQSAALCSGIAASRAPLIATIDGDLQNDPADIPRLLAEFQRVDQQVLVAGNRARRRDSWLRRLSSRIANGVRGWLLNDQCPDTGCSLKLFRRDTFLLLPQFDHMHRFLPALFAAQGVPIINIPVNHRPRVAGESKYGVGNRLWVGMVDLAGVRWLQRRRFRLNAAQRQEMLNRG